MGARFDKLFRNFDDKMRTANKVLNPTGRDEL